MKVLGGADPAVEGEGERGEEEGGGQDEQEEGLSAEPPGTVYEE